MSRVRHYLEIDVLTAAKQRIEHILDTHDTPVVCFSGGKDSLVVLHLMLEAVKARGQDKLAVVFRDEELIPQVVIDFVDRYRVRDDIEMVWFCVPLKSQKYILGKSAEYLQWDPAREHIREIPEWGYTDPEGRVFDQYSMDNLVAGMYPGMVALVNGIRADESLIRFRASVNKLNDSYINASQSRKAHLCKPIYDWTETDIFKYLHDHKIPYCAQYDLQMWAKMGLRVATPLHAEQAKRFGKWREVDPVFYEGLIRLFPEMLVQERYYREMDRGAVLRKYGKTYFGVRRYIREHIAEEQRPGALHHLSQALTIVQKDPEGYSPEMLLKWAMSGSFKRIPLPFNRKQRAKNRAKK